jgi:hypothetical protein
MSVNKKRKDLIVTKKLHLIDTHDKLNLRSLSQRGAAAKLGVPHSTLSELLKSHDTLNTNTTSEDRKRKREGKCHAVDEVLLIWFKQASSYNAPINRSICYKKPMILVKNYKKIFKATDVWLTRWKERHGIVHKKLLEKNKILVAQRAWMTASIFEDYLRIWDRQLNKKKKKLH